MNEMASLKVEARKAAFARRKAAHAVHQSVASRALVEHLKGTSGQIIAGYLPIRTESDPLPAMQALAGENRICVPVVLGKGKPLEFREWRPGCALVEGSFGVMIPVDGDVLTPDLVIVPMVAFEPRLYRLGYGGGFYDRTLEGLRAKGTCTALGFAYDAQEAPSLPLEPTDQPLDALITETGLRRRSDLA